MVTKGEIYRHFKGGVYGIVEVALHHETRDIFVVYRNLETSECFIRPLEDFEGIANCGVKRFKLIDKVEIKN